MTNEDLPPYLRETNRDRPVPSLEVPLELPRDVPCVRQPEEKDEQPPDPFLRKS